MRRSIAVLLLLGALAPACIEGKASPFDLSSLPRPQVRAPYLARLAVPGYPEGVTFRVTEGRLPFGLVLEPDGRIRGQPTAVQRSEFAITASAPAHGRSWTSRGSLNVSDPQGLRLLVEDLPVVAPGRAFSHRLSATGGTPISWALARVRTFTEPAGQPGLPPPSVDGVPSWLSLDASTGLLSGVAPADERVVLLLVEASDGAATVREVYGLRVGDAREPGWLMAKSEAYVARQAERHLPAGLHLATEADGCFSNYGDSCCWSATSMGGLAYRAAVLGEDRATDLVAERLDGLRRLRRITGLGIPGRAYEHRENIGGPCGRWYMDLQNPEQHEGAGEFAGYRFWVETSRDQITGNLWGHAIVHEILVDRPGLRALAAENIVSVAQHVWDHEMKLVDLDGLTTDYGMMSGYGFDGFDPYQMGMTMANGMNAIMLINWFQMAARVAPDAATREAFGARLAHLIADEPNPEPGREFEHSYLDLLHDSYAYAEYPPGSNYFSNMRWYNVHMAFSTYFHAVRWAEDPALRQALLGVFRTLLWEDRQPMASGCDAPELRRARREQNPHFTWQYLAAYGDRDPEAIFAALTQMMYWIAVPRQDYPVANPLDLPTVPDHPDYTCEAVPVHLRPQSSNYLWHREPYRHTGGNDTPGREDGGGDGFVPYWMGRYFGFVPGNL